MLRNLEAACLNQDKEQKRLTAELDVAKRDQEKLRRDREHRLEDLRRLESDNNNTKKDQPEQ